MSLNLLCLTYTIIFLIIKNDSIIKHYQTQYLSGEWKVTQVIPLITYNKDDFNEYSSKCVGTRVDIKVWGENNFSIKIDYRCDEEHDFDQCDDSYITTALDVKVKKKDREELRKVPEVDFCSDKVFVNKTFLNTLGLNLKKDKLEGFKTNCKISWGDESLGILLVNKKEIILYCGSMLIILHRS